MQALGLVQTWPVPSVCAAVIVGSGDDASVVSIGDSTRSYRLASIAKPIAAWATLVAVEEGIVTLDTPVGQPGCTLQHLLAHAGGYGFDGTDPIAPPGRRRIYSNTGIEMAANAVAEAAGMDFATYLDEAVLAPLGMRRTTLRGSAAHALYSTLDDLVAFTSEVMRPTLISSVTAGVACSPVFADLAGIVPGVGRYSRCSWGLGFEIRDVKAPHWTGTSNSPATFGHFGGAGTFVWVDPGEGADRAVACVVLTDRPFDEWAAEALELWPQLSDAVLAEVRGVAR